MIAGYQIYRRTKQNTRALAQPRELKREDATARDGREREHARTRAGVLGFQQRRRLGSGRGAEYGANLRLCAGGEAEAAAAARRRRAREASEASGARARGGYV